jgi:hypothetical protein
MKLKSVLASAILMAIPFAAEATTTYTFDTVTKVAFGSSLAITGVLVGDISPTTFTAITTTSSCDDLFRQVLDAPSTYILTVTFDTFSGPPTSYNSVKTCSLERRP